MLIYVYKFIFILAFAFIGYYNPPFGTTHLHGALMGAVFALALSVLAVRIKNTEIKNVWSATIGLLLGALVGWIMYLMYSEFSLAWSSVIFGKAIFLIGFVVLDFPSKHP